MQIKTTARHFELTPALKDHVEERLNRLTKYAYPILEAHVILSVEKYRNIAEITVHGNGVDFSGKAEAADMYVAVDEVCDKLETQVRKHKDRVKDHKKTPREERASEGEYGAIEPS